MRVEDVRFREVLAVKTAVRAVPAAARLRVRARANSDMATNEIDAVDGLLICGAVGFAPWVLSQFLVLMRWIITGRGRGTRALVLSI